MAKSCCKKTGSVEKKEVVADKTPAQKAVDTRRKNKIAEQQEKLEKSTSSAAHKQWITKKNNEILAKNEKIVSLTAEKKELKAQIKLLQTENKALAKEVAKLQKKLAPKAPAKTVVAKAPKTTKSGK
ncbi:hypothetical protein [Treponema sp.]|uniref:hypothetical protein n=1 Tax=Treponema sp. TaxID=166 RepID=UPI00298D6C3E|nr:hypothetical protein [Treponema sp.]MCQ2240848.1 hypothetical protein [Treponema sp.]